MSTALLAVLWWAWFIAFALVVMYRDGPAKVAWLLAVLAAGAVLGLRTAT